MFVYVGLIQLTPEGRHDPESTPEYLHEIRHIVEGEGGILEQVFPMEGPWDFFSIVKYPDNETALRVLAKLSLHEAVHTQTFTEVSTRPGLWRSHEAGPAASLNPYPAS